MLPTRHELTLIIYVCVCGKVLYTSLWEGEVPTRICRAAAASNSALWFFISMLVISLLKIFSMTN